MTAEKRPRRKPLSRSLTRSDWIAVFAVVVSLASAWFAYTAPIRQSRFDALKEFENRSAGINELLSQFINGLNQNSDLSEFRNKIGAFVAKEISLVEASTVARDSPNETRAYLDALRDFVNSSRQVNMVADIGIWISSYDKLSNARLKLIVVTRKRVESIKN